MPISRQVKNQGCVGRPGDHRRSTGSEIFEVGVDLDGKCLEVSKVCQGCFCGVDGGQPPLPCSC